MTAALSFAPSIRRPVAADLPFVIGAWKRGLRKLPEYRSVANDRFFPWISARIQRVLSSPDTRALLSCDERKPDHLYGFVVANHDARVCLWLYVIQSMRQGGIGRALWNAAGSPSSVPYPAAQLRLPEWARMCKFDPCGFPP